jgi:DNA-binding transcriptional regulator YiaG
VTTATATRKKKTKKKTKTSKVKTTRSTKKVKTTGGKRTTKKKPKWSLVTLKQIESRRGALSLSKLAMASLVGVTNSTYHNWCRGTTVPHEAQQEKIVAAMHTGPSIVPKTQPKKAKVPANKNGTSRAATRSSKKTTDLFGSAAFLSDGANAAELPRVASTNRCEPTDAPLVESGQSTTRPVVEKVQIVETLSRQLLVSNMVTAYINGSKGKASAASIISLAKGLNAIFA